VTIINEDDFPSLKAILFGEGVVNDAVSILIYRAISAVIKEEEIAGK
jgi:NhaP-type Na+/H+ or K+/H+ antiporter